MTKIASSLMNPKVKELLNRPTFGSYQRIISLVFFDPQCTFIPFSIPVFCLAAVPRFKSFDSVLITQRVISAIHRMSLLLSRVCRLVLSACKLCALYRTVVRCCDAIFHISFLFLFRVLHMSKIN